MFLKKELTKRANELYYRRYQNFNISPLKENYSSAELMDNIYESVKIGDEELSAIYSDLQIVHILCSKNVSEYSRPLVEKYEKANAKIKDNLPKDEIVSILSEIDETYIVGGWVRDTLADKPVNDIDFCTSMPYDELAKILVDKGFKVSADGKQFLVLNVSKDGEQYEIAQLRADNYVKKPKYVRRIKK